LAVPSSTVEETPAASSSAPAPFPEKIWYKLGPKGQSNESREWTDSCIKKNPTFQPHFFTDLSADVYVRETFTDRPDIIEVYTSLTIPILKADMLRYLLLWAEGGVYFDLDVSCEDTPILDWIPDEYKNVTNLVVGWEFDMGWGDNLWREFASWTMLARPGLPHMAQVVDDIIEDVGLKSSEHNVTIAELNMEMIGDVVDITGPRRMTSGIFKSLSRMLNRTVDAEDSQELLEPKLIGDVLILPGFSFALSSNAYEEGLETPALVVHHYAGSWKNGDGGEVLDSQAEKSKKPGNSKKPASGKKPAGSKAENNLSKQPDNSNPAEVVASG
jgi:mannosyltransferase OCH1-like enzyme